MAKTIDKFLNPESMITPGVAGGITMAISNTLWIQFTLQPRWTGLVLSFVFGALVFVTARLPVWQRAVYYVVNSLIIFSVAAGSNYAGMLASGPEASNAPVTASAERAEQRARETVALKQREVQPLTESRQEAIVAAAPVPRLTESAKLSKSAAGKVAIDRERAALQMQREEIERARIDLEQQRAKLQQQQRAAQAQPTGKPVEPAKDAPSRFFVRW